MRGAGELLCGMPVGSTNIHGTAALCRPNLPHTLRSPTGGVEAATAPSFLMAQGLGCATGTRALSPRDPDFPSFPREKKENKKSAKHSFRHPHLPPTRSKPPALRVRHVRLVRQVRRGTKPAVGRSHTRQRHFISHLSSLIIHFRLRFLRFSPPRFLLTVEMTVSGGYIIGGKPKKL